MYKPSECMTLHDTVFANNVCTSATNSVTIVTN